MKRFQFILTPFTENHHFIMKTPQGVLIGHKQWFSIHRSWLVARALLECAAGSTNSGVIQSGSEDKDNL